MIDPGWNRVKADCLTLGELFLMVGSGGGGSNVIELCYTWLPNHENAGEQEENTEDGTAESSKSNEKRTSEDDSFLHSAAISRLAGAELAKIQLQKSTSSSSSSGVIFSPSRCNNAAQNSSPSTTPSKTAAATASAAATVTISMPLSPKKEAETPMLAQAVAVAIASPSTEFRRPIAVPPSPPPVPVCEVY